MAGFGSQANLCKTECYRMCRHCTKETVGRKRFDRTASATIPLTYSFPSPHPTALLSYSKMSASRGEATEIEGQPVSLSEQEFAVLRQTIASRGTTRMVLLPVTLIGWSALSLLLLLFSEVPLAALLPSPCWSAASKPSTHSTLASNASAATSRSFTKRATTRHAGKRRRCPSDRHSLAGESTPSSPSSSSALLS